jgi:hypothetical protein
MCSSTGARTVSFSIQMPGSDPPKMRVRPHRFDFPFPFSVRENIIYSEASALRA